MIVVADDVFAGCKPWLQMTFFGGGKPTKVPSQDQLSTHCAKTKKMLFHFGVEQRNPEAPHSNQLPKVIHKLRGPRNTAKLHPKSLENLDVLRRTSWDVLENRSQLVQCTMVCLESDESLHPSENCLYSSEKFQSCCLVLFRCMHLIAEDMSLDCVCIMPRVK